MAEIEVRKKQPMAWLWWILGALILAGLLWWILSDEGPERVEDPATVVEGSAETPPPAQPAEAGEVRLEAVPVVEVVSDLAFWVGSGADRTFVVLDENVSPTSPIEGQVDVNQGQTVTITGTSRMATEPAPLNVQIPEGVDRYVIARTVEIQGNR